MPDSLAGIRVIDATQMLAGPLAAMRLGDLGADVIKVEPPRGELNRDHGFNDIVSNGQMTSFLSVNRNKRSLAVDLKTDAGRAVMYDLIRASDVLLENFKPATTERLGIDFETVHKINPKLVYCAISGFGSDGPYRDRPGQDLLMQGYSGSLFSSGAATDPPHPGPLWAPDVLTGYQAVVGTLAALRARDSIGVGQLVEVDMLGVVMDCQIQELVTYLNSGYLPKRTAESSAHALIPAPYGVYKTKDSWMTLANVPLDALGRLLDDDYLKGLTEINDGDVHRDEVYRRLRHRFEDRTTDEWLADLHAAGLWAGPVFDYAQLIEDKHVIARGYVVEQPQRVGGSARTIRPPLRMSATPAGIRRGAPELGSHSAEILRTLLGYDDERVATLVDDGVVAVTEGN